ncbi:MAG: GtrA family protein [Magnetospiraceae bacterium]
MNKLIPRHLLNRVVMREAVRYFFASLAALGVDLGVLFLCHQVLGMDVLWASSLGFMAGMIFIYIVSIRKIFEFRRLEGAAATEFAWFWITGFIGLGITALAMPFLVSNIGFGLLPAKVLTSGGVFTFNYVSRKLLLFTNWEAAADKPSEPPHP